VRGATKLALPYLAGLFLLVAVPALLAFALAFTEFPAVAAPRFNGVDNFIRLFRDAGYATALWNSLIYLALSVPLRVVAAVGIALLMYRRSRGVGAARAAAYLPTVVPDVAFGLLWLWLLNPLYGPIPGALQALGLPSPDWLIDPWSARFAVAIMSAFQIGEGFVIALAVRRLIPSSLYEAALLDGAGPWFTLTRLTLPLMAPAIALLALRDVVLALQANFVPALIVTDGGPRLATTFLSIYVYRQAFAYFRLGYASTISLTMFVLTAGIVYAQYRLARRWRLL